MSGTRPSALGIRGAGSRSIISLVASYLDSVPFSGIIRIRDLMYAVDKPYRLDQGDVSFDAPDSVKDALLRGVAENRTHYVQTTGIPRLLELLAMKMREKKEQEGKLSWSLCLYGTQSMADEAGLSLDGYWEQIIEACYLREEDPVTKWKEVQKEIEEIKDKLDALGIEKLHIKGDDVDLHILVGEHRNWLSGGG